MNVLILFITVENVFRRSKRGMENSYLPPNPGIDYSNFQILLNRTVEKYADKTAVLMRTSRGEEDGYARWTYGELQKWNNCAAATIS